MLSRPLQGCCTCSLLCSSSPCLVFFSYLLLCFAVPAKEGVAGIAGITKAKGDAYADPEQYDPESPCYEPKGDQADGPRWYCVDLEPVREFSPFIPFNVIRAAAEMDLPFISKEDKKALSDWSLLKQGRLSVHEVSDAQYKAILNIEKALAEGKEFPVAAGNLFGPKGKAAAAAAPEGDEKKKKTTTGKKKGKAATDEEDGEDDGAVEAGAGAGASKQLSGKKRKRATAE